MHRTLVLLISCLLLPIVAAGGILWQSAAAPSKTLRDYRKLCLKLRYAIKLFHIQAHVASVGSWCRRLRCCSALCRFSAMGCLGDAPEPRIWGMARLA
jgi:hypothetical protein